MKANPSTVVEHLAQCFAPHSFSQQLVGGCTFLTIDGRRTSVRLDELEFTEINAPLLADLTGRVSKFIGKSKPTR